MHECISYFYSVFVENFRSDSIWLNYLVEVWFCTLEICSPLASVTLNSTTFASLVQFYFDLIFLFWFLFLFLWMNETVFFSLGWNRILFPKNRTMLSTAFDTFFICPVFFCDCFNSWYFSWYCNLNSLHEISLTFRTTQCKNQNLILNQEISLKS